jgi:hypothetical protein
MLSLLLLASVTLSAPTLPQAPDPAAKAVVDTALARMGGAEAVARVQRVRREMLTTWQRTSFRDEPYADAPSFELHTDIRDYGLNAWKNTRKFGFGPTTQQIVDIVNDTVAIRQLPNGVWGSLSIAYVDERRELFAIAPERILLAARDAADLKLGRDTTIDGLPVARVTATVDRFAMTIFVRRGDGLPAMARFKAAQPNDFGLLEWGPMEVETWYSRWSRTAAGVALPFQLDQRRVGRPYKRMSVLAMAFDTVATAETFAISDSLRGVYFAKDTRAMHDVPLDSARVVDGAFARFGAPGSPAGGVKIGGRWVLLEAGQGELSADRAVDWLAANDAGTPVGGAVLTMTSPGNGGVTALARRRIPTRVGPGARPFVDRMLGNTGVAGVAPVTVTRAEWVKVGSDSLWLAPIDLPDAPRSLVVYSPTLKWAYSANAFAPLQQQYLLAALRGRGWSVEKVGSARAITAPAPR